MIKKVWIWLPFFVLKQKLVYLFQTTNCLHINWCQKHFLVNASNTIICYLFKLIHFNVILYSFICLNNYWIFVFPGKHVCEFLLLTSRKPHYGRKEDIPRSMWYQKRKWNSRFFIRKIKYSIQIRMYGDRIKDKV